MSTRVVLASAGALGILAGSWWIACHPASATPRRPKPPSDGPLEVVHGEGRLAAYPGADVTLGAEISGRIDVLRVQEKDMVEKGALIASIDCREYDAALAEARARLAEVEAEVRYRAIDLERIEKLWQARSTAKELLDQVVRDHAMSKARRDVWAAAVERQRALLAKTKVVAPFSGQIVVRHANAGEMVRPGDPIVRLVDRGRLRIEAEVDEFDALRVRVGALVVITAAGNPGVSWKGVVEEIPDSIGARKLKPQDPARPTDANILLAKIALEEKTPLILGQRVEVVLDVPRAVSNSLGRGPSYADGKNSMP